jgi:hypothetical protein
VKLTCLISPQSSRARDVHKSEELCPRLLAARKSKRFMTITAEQFQGICDGVWRDRFSVMQRRGCLSEEAALMRAVYWRLSKIGIASGSGNQGSQSGASSYRIGVGCLLELHARPRFDGVGILNDLLQRYKEEVSEINRQLNRVSSNAVPSLSSSSAKA